MENLWQMKCGSGSKLHSMEDNFIQVGKNLGNIADSRPLVQGTGQDHVFCNSSNLASYKSGHADLGNSFLALLSAPPSLLQHDFQELSEPSQFVSSNKVPFDNGISYVNGSGIRSPATSVVLSPLNTSKQSLQNSVDHSSIISSKYLTGSINSCFGMPDADRAVHLSSQSSEVPTQIVQQRVPCNEKMEDFPAASNALLRSPNVAGKPCDVNLRSFQKFPSEVNLPVSPQSSTYTSGFPHVLCMGRSGTLLVSNTGLIGVVCSCHCLHMSVARFCEHSGLHGVNPGDAVRMDSGETVAVWRKLYFEKFKIRVPEDQSEWDWPDELSITSHFLKSSAFSSNMSNSTGSSHLVSTEGGLVRSEQPLDIVDLNKPRHAGKTLVTDALHNRLMNVQDADSSVLKGFMGTLHGDLHDVVQNQLMDCPALTTSKYDDKGPNAISQCFPAYSVTENKNSSTILAALQSIRTLGKNYDISRFNDAKDGVIVDREAVSSNVELRLGQPCQQNWTVGDSALPLLGPEHRSTLVDTANTVLQKKTIYNVANSKGHMENRHYIHSASGQSTSSSVTVQNQLNLGNNVFGDGDALVTSGKNKLNMIKSLDIPPLPFSKMPPAQSVHLKFASDIEYGKEHVMSKALCSDSWNVSSCPRSLAKELNPIYNRIGGEAVSSGSCISTDSATGIDNRAEVLRCLAKADRQTVPNPSVVNVKSVITHQLSGTPLDVSDSRKLLNSSDKVPILDNGITEVEVTKSIGFSTPSGLVSSSQPISIGLTPSSSNPISHKSPPLPKQDGIGASPYLLDESLRLIALGQILELSKQQHTISSFRVNQQHSVVGPVIAGVQGNALNFARKEDILDAALKALHCGYSGGVCSRNDRLAPLTGNPADCSCCNNWCNMSLLSPESRMSCKGMENLCSHNLHDLHNRLRTEINTEPSEHERCHQLSSAVYKSHCACSGCTSCLEGNCQSKILCSHNAQKEENCNVNGRGSSLVASHIILTERTVPLDQSRKLKGQIPSGICHASQWKDVPRKVINSNVTSKEAPEEMFNGGGDEEGQLENRADSHLGRESRFLDTSNISSGCSAPVVTQVTAEVNKMDSSTVEAVNTGDMDNAIVDEGSGIERCWSSDEALASEQSAEYCGSSTRVLENGGSSSISKGLTSRTLLDELKLIDSMTWKRGRNQMRSGLADNHLKRNTQQLQMTLNVGKRRRSLKSNMVDKSFRNCNIQPRSKRRRSTAFSSPELLSRKRYLDELYCDKEERPEDQTESYGHAGFGKPLVFYGKKHRRHMHSTELTQPCTNTSACANSTKNLILDSSSCTRAPSCQLLSPAYKRARPVVCGKYGEIANGLDEELSKPPKFLSLSRVLKNAKQCTVHRTCKPKLTNTRELKGWGDKGSAMCFEKDSKCKNMEDWGNHDIPNQHAETSLVKFNKPCTVGSGPSGEFAMEAKYKSSGSREDYHVRGSNSCNKQKAKHKEIRKRSLYELTMEGKKFSPQSLSLEEIPNCGQAAEIRRENDKVNACHMDGQLTAKSKRCIQGDGCASGSDSDELCCVCGSSNKDDVNNLLECYQCFIRVHQACYGISRVPKGNWYCRPCRINAKDIACVLCGYGGGAMTHALKSGTIVKSLLKAWNIGPLSKDHLTNLEKMDFQSQVDVQKSPSCMSNFEVQNSITVGVLDNTVKQWVHMVCALWTPGTRCPNVDTMNAFDVSGALHLGAKVVCSLCRRPGGSCIKCRAVGCSVQFHPWCAHQKGLLQSEVEGANSESVGFYGRCSQHSKKCTDHCEKQPSDCKIGGPIEKEPTCARTEGYKGRKLDGSSSNLYGRSNGEEECLVLQEQLNAWNHINGKKICKRGPSNSLKVRVEHDCRKEYARNKQAKGWKHLVVYKSSIHALGLYTSRFISRGEMVVEYVGEIVRPRVADKREMEYQSGKRLQYESACYFFRIDKEHIIDATRKGGIARFVNHSCMPNCVAKVISVMNENKVVFFAERDIFPGEEITYDYHFNHEDEGKKIPCLCNSTNCRRYLN